MTTIKVMMKDRYRLAGRYAAPFAALGFSPDWRGREIREIPVELYMLIKDDPYMPFTVNTDDMKPFEQIQPRFAMLNRQWLEARQAEQARARQQAEEYQLEQEIARVEAQAEAEKRAKLEQAARKNLGIGVQTK